MHTPFVRFAVVAGVVAGLATPTGAMADPARGTTGSHRATSQTAPVRPEPETGLVGVPRRPSRDVAALKKRLAEAPGARQQSLAARSPISGYVSSSATMQVVPPGLRGMEDTVLTPVGGYGVVDSTGVRMFRWAGDPTLWNHPVGQAQYALHSLDSYRLTGNAAYLETARKNAQRLVDRRVVSDGAWYYPYDFDFAVHGDTTETLLAPWYSAMAQGQALSAFVRMYEVTRAPEWKTAADATFASLLQAPAGMSPFASRVDSIGRLWFEEYPRYPVANSEMVLNGHIFAMWGVHDYWMLTRSTAAESLFLGSLSTIERSVMSQFRRPGWLSVYSLRHKVNTLSYHKVHIDQFEVLWRMTREARWITTATAFRDDFPSQAITGTVDITPNVRTMYRANAGDSVITGSRRVAFSRATAAPFDRRQRLKGGPIAYRISAGAYTGWWVAEGYAAAWGRGALDGHFYAPAARVVYRGGSTITGYRLGSGGVVVGISRLRVPVGRSLTASTQNSAIVRGRPSYLVRTGALAGYWVPISPNVTVR